MKHISLLDIRFHFVPSFTLNSFPRFYPRNRVAVSSPHRRQILHQKPKMNPVMPVPRLIQLATTIKDSVLKIQEILDTLGVLSPSFDENAPPLPVQIGEAQDIVLGATAELHDLLTEPTNMIHRSARVKITHLDIFHRREANIAVHKIRVTGLHVCRRSLTLVLRNSYRLMGRLRLKKFLIGRH